MDSKNAMEKVWDALAGLLRGAAAGGVGRVSPGMRPAAYVALRQTPAAEGPGAEVREALREAYEENCARNIVLRTVYEVAREALGAGGIEASPLKGIYLAEAVYPDFGARVFEDVDIFVERGARREAVRRLEGAGFRVKRTYLGDQGAGPSGVLFESPGPRAAWVELHWNLLDETGLRGRMLSGRDLDALADGVASGRVEGTFGEKPARLLAAHHFLLHLVLHYFCHGLRGKKWEVDLLLYPTTMAVDWDAYFGVVRRFGLGRVHAVVFEKLVRDYGEGLVAAGALAGMKAEDRRAARRVLVAEGRQYFTGALLLCYPTGWRAAAAVGRWLFPSPGDLSARVHGRVGLWNYGAAWAGQFARPLTTPRDR